MSKKGLSAQERMIRIELARTRAALERQNVVLGLDDLKESLTPAELWHSLFSSSRRSRTRRTNWISEIIGLSRRYPYLLASASAILSSVGRRRGGLAWRLGLGALAGWKLLQRAQRRSDSTGEGAVTPVQR